MTRNAVASPDDWARTLGLPPTLRATAGRRSPVMIRRWKGTQPDVQQPGLDQHYVVLHLGGPKRVSRRGPVGVQVSEMDVGALSIIPAGHAYTWRTEGAIDYAHIYIPQGRLARAREAISSGAGREARLLDRVGVNDPLLRSLFEEILSQVEVGDSDGLYVDCLFDALLGRLLHAHADVTMASTRTRNALPPRRLAAVLDHIEAHLGEGISLEDLAAVAQLSPFHFTRAFAQTTGRTPHAYVVERRLEAAKVLLKEGDLSIEAVGRRCGFANPSHFSTRFRRAEGVTPRAYRRGG
jgi:AraC family transcriptional regulator